MLRLVLILLLALGALWWAVTDWQATIGVGQAYRFTGLGQALSSVSPGAAGFVARFGAGQVGGFVLALPLAVLLGAAAFGLWATRPRRR